MTAAYESHEGARLGKFEAAEYLSVIFPAYSVNYIRYRPVLCTTISPFIICPLVFTLCLPQWRSAVSQHCVCPHSLHLCCAESFVCQDS